MSVMPTVERTSPLHKALLSVEGVASAEVDEANGAPTGVRVRLEPDADPAAVGEEVQRVLSAHGIRARVDDASNGEEEPSTRRRQPGPPPPPGAGAVVSLAEATRGPVPVAIDRAAIASVAGASLSGVAVEESRDGVVVTASTLDGRREARRARWTEGGLEEAVVAAVSALAGCDPPPKLLGTRQVEVEEATVVLVVVERHDGRRLAGAAVVEAGAPFALARAVWAALVAED